MASAKQLETLKIVREYISSHGIAPTTQEIANKLGISSRGVVHRYLKALEKEGHIQLLSQQKRNIVLTPANASNIDEQTVPILGYIAAGQPIEAIAHHDALDITKMFLGPGRYALRVKGDSMIDDGIFDGDIVVCQQTKTAQPGQVVVALIDQEYATLKRIKFEAPNTVLLEPANAAYNVQRYTADRVNIQGILIGLLRLNH